jgi:hypothetical protein
MGASPENFGYPPRTPITKIQDGDARIALFIDLSKSDGNPDKIRAVAPLA